MTAAGTRILNCSGFGIILPLILGTWTILVLKNVIFAVVNVFLSFPWFYISFPYICIYANYLSKRLVLSSPDNCWSRSPHLFEDLPSLLSLPCSNYGRICCFFTGLFFCFMFDKFLFVLPNQFQSCKLN